MTPASESLFLFPKPILIIHPPRIAEDKEGLLVSARVDFERQGLNVPEELWYRFPSEYIDYVSEDIDGFLVALLPSAMALGENITVEAPVSQRLAFGLRDYQNIQNAWWPDEFNMVDIEYREFRKPGGVKPKAVGSSFSGGVDAFYTLWQHLARNEEIPAAQITHCLMINGFDKDTDLNKTGWFQKMYERYAHHLKGLGVELLTVMNNLRFFRVPLIKPQGLSHSHAAPLAASAMIMGRLWNRFYIPGSSSYASLMPEGSHPMSDHLLSTEELSIVHDGANASRTEKIEQVSRLSETREYLRVCIGQPIFNAQSGVIENCCRCTKCVETMIALELLDVLHESPTFPRPLCRKHIWNASMRRWRYQENLQLARRVGRRDVMIDLRYWSMLERQRAEKR